MVERLKKNDYIQYISLIKEVFGYEASIENIEKHTKDNTVLVIKKSNVIVASVSIKEQNDFVKGQKYYFVSNLCVLKEYRREGLASILFNEVDRLAEKNSIDYLLLTSGNQRRAAHYFYKSRNFKIKDTTVFIKFY